MPATARTHHRHAATCLTHIFGGGLEADERFVVERFQSTADGQIRPLDEGQVKGGRKPRTTMSRRSVRRLRPERNPRGSILSEPAARGSHADTSGMGTTLAGFTERVPIRARLRCRR